MDYNLDSIKKMKLFKIPNVLFPILLLLICFIVYYPVITNNQFFCIDDHLLITRFETIKTLKDLYGSRMIDLQPVRDIINFFQYRIWKENDLFTFGFINVLIWFFANLYLYKILVFLKIDKTLSFLISVLFLTSPVFVIAVAWYSALKHLLSFLFTMMAVYFFITNKNLILTGSCYFLSLLSHPINVFWFIWAYFYNKSDQNISKENKKNKFNLIYFLVIIGMLLILFNIYYYYYYGVNENKAPTLPVYGWHAIVEILMSFGRYFYNFVFPFDLAIYYKVISIDNFVGLFFFILFGYWNIVNYKSLKKYWPWLVLGFFSLSTVTLHKLKIFVSNTYSLTFYASLVIFLLLALNDSKFKNQKKTYLIPILLIFIFSINSNIESSNWSDSVKVLKASYENEQEMNIGASYVANSISKLNKNGNDKITEEMLLEYVDIILELKKQIKDSSVYEQNSFFGAWQSFSGLVLRAKNIKIENKLEILKVIEDKNIIYSNISMMVSYMQLNNFENGEKYLNLILKQLKVIKIPNSPDVLRKIYLKLFETIFAQLQLVASKIDKISNDKTNYLITVNEFVFKIMPPPSWNEIQKIYNEMLQNGNTLKEHKKEIFEKNSNFFLEQLKSEK